MLRQDSVQSAYAEFVLEVEPKLRHALIGALGPEAAREATAEAIAYGWEAWDRLSKMENPAGYVYRVAQTAARRARREAPLFPAVASDEMPWVEPGLPAALRDLTRNQRVAVWAIHGLGWRPDEIAKLLDISSESARTHARRGMKKLRRNLGGES